MFIPSALLGLAAWMIPVLCLARSGKPRGETPILAMVVSLGLCGAVLCMQVHYAAVEAREEDFAALMDVMPTLSMVCIVLLGVTLALSIAVWAVYRRR